MKRLFKNSRLTHYLSLALLVATFSFGGWVTMGCSPQVTIPTGRLAANQEAVAPGDDGGIVFDQTAEEKPIEAAYELPSQVEYGGEMIPIKFWQTQSLCCGDRVVEGNTAIIVNDPLVRRRTAVFVGYWDDPGDPQTERRVLFPIRVGSKETATAR